MNKLATIAAIGYDAVHRISNTPVAIYGKGNDAQYAALNLLGLGTECLSIEHVKINPQSILGRYSGTMQNFQEALVDLAGYVEVGFVPKGSMYPAIDFDTYICHLTCNKREQIPRAPPEIAGTLAANIIRKYLAPSSKRETPTTTCSVLENLLEKRQPYEHVLQVGCGGIGTYVALTSIDKRTTLVDHDTIEESNLNRQILYRQHLGEQKAKVLSNICNRMSLSVSQFEYSTRKIVSENDAIFTSEYSCIISCADNFAVRNVLLTVAKQRNIPFVDAGCTYRSGIVAHGTADYVDRRRKISTLAKTEQIAKKKSCLTANPSVIVPNVLCGILATQLPFATTCLISTEDQEVISHEN